jgi:hypothetical protein
MSSRVCKKNISRILSRLVDEKVIVRVSNKNGCFRKVERECEEMDLLNADSKNTFDIDFPLGLSKLVRLYPGSIVIIAGDQNAGKTAFLLNTVRNNLVRYSGRIHYFNSEMGDDAFKERLEDFGYPIDSWLDHVKFMRREDNFSDVIHSDDLNIVDYLEVLEDFHQVGRKIKDIFVKLKRGIAIIGLQKKGGSDLGRGAEFGLEKPTLYLSMGNGKLKIIKAKSWANRHKNPNGMEFVFKLAGGCRFVDVSSNILSETEF